MQPTGVRFSAERRIELAKRAWKIAHAMELEGKTFHKQSVEVCAELDVSIPTARNLIAYGRRLAIENG